MNNDLAPKALIRKAIAARSTYREGDVIGQRYQVHRLLGRGGFGLVYLVTQLDDSRTFALKTFRDDFIFDEAVKRQFKIEAMLWVQLGWHHFIVQAHQVQYIDGRLFVAMEHVPRDENGLVTVYDHIAHHRNKLNDRQIGAWVVAFCHGMEHAQTHGILAHRDIKPANLLVSPDGLLKISDFGIAASLAASSKMATAPEQRIDGLTIMNTGGKSLCGTPGYIAPEIFRSERAGAHSDIFSFGVTLWQLAAGTTAPPYAVQHPDDPARLYKDLYQQQERGRVIPIQSVFWPIIQKCLEPDPSRRFSGFDELRSATKSTMRGAGIAPIDFIINKEWNAVPNLVNQGACFRELGLFDEALKRYDEALKAAPNRPAIFLNKGNALAQKGSLQEAIKCFDAALKIDPKFEAAWLNKGRFLQKAGQHERAVQSFDALLKINPGHAIALNRKGMSCLAIGRLDEAERCYDEAIRIKPDDHLAWTRRGKVFSASRKVSDAMVCYDRAIELRADYHPAWINKARELVIARRRSEGLEIFNALASAYSTDAAVLNEIGVGLCLVHCFADPPPNTIESYIKCRIECEAPD